MEIFVHDTAFVIAYYRAQHEQISRDPYAKLWLRPTLKTFADEFASHVSIHDEILHCFRNRFFHDTLQDLAKENEKLLLINLGAGFSMYPYVLPANVETIEVDFPEVTQYKETWVKTFSEEKQLPDRMVSHVNANITVKENQDRLKKMLKPFHGWRKVVLIEGVFFFLSEIEIEQVMSFCKDILQKDDQLLCVSFDQALKGSAVFNRLTTYFTEVLKSEENPFTLIPHRFYEQLPGFQLASYNCGLSMAQAENCLKKNLSETDVLNEFFYILKRI